MRTQWEHITEWILTILTMLKIFGWLWGLLVMIITHDGWWNCWLNNGFAGCSAQIVHGIPPESHAMGWTQCEKKNYHWVMVNIQAKKWWLNGDGLCFGFTPWFGLLSLLVHWGFAHPIPSHNITGYSWSYNRNILWTKNNSTYDDPSPMVV